MNELAWALALLGTGLNVLFAWPQVLRARRDTEGISGLTCSLGLTGRAAWTTYAAVTAQPALAIGQIPPGIAYLITAVLLWRATPAQRRVLLVATLAGFALIAASATLGSDALGIVATVTAAGVATPQLAALMRRSGTGVSPASYLLAALASAIWIGYAITKPDAYVAIPHLVLLPTNLAVAWKAGRSRTAT